MSALGWGGTRLVGSMRGLGADAGAQLVGGTLASLGPGLQTEIDSRLTPAAGMIEQAWGQLNQATSAGLSSDQQQIHELTLNKLETALKGLHDEAANFKGSDSNSVLSDWDTRAQALVNDIHTELTALVALNQGSIASQGYVGLAWGLGIAAAVAGIGFLVWRQKRRRRG